MRRKQERDRSSPKYFLNLGRIKKELGALARAFFMAKTFGNRTRKLVFVSEVKRQELKNAIPSLV